MSSEWTPSLSARLSTLIQTLSVAKASIRVQCGQFSGNGQNFQNSNAHRLEGGEGSCVQRKTENRATRNKACLDKMVQAEADCLRQFEYIPILTSKVNSVTAKRRNCKIRMTQPLPRSSNTTTQ